jgi:hypothetical protein
MRPELPGCVLLYSDEKLMPHRSGAARDWDDEAARNARINKHLFAQNNQSNTGCHN